MSYEFYKILHLISLISLFLSLGMLIVGPQSLRKLIMSLHGVALLLLLVSGFGLIAKLHIPLKFLSPSWFWKKTFIWIALAGLTPFLINKKGEQLTVKKAALFVSIILALAFYALWQITYR